MKTDYKEKDTVIIRKDFDKLDGFGGIVLSNNPISDKPLKVDFNTMGVWQYGYEHILQNTSENKPTQPTKSEIATTISTENKKTLKQAKIKSNDKPEKRAYRKRGEKPKEVKIKRAYNRKKVD